MDEWSEEKDERRIFHDENKATIAISEQNS